MITVNLPQTTMNGKIPAKLKKFILNQPIFESYLNTAQKESSPLHTSEYILNK